MRTIRPPGISFRCCLGNLGLYYNADGIGYSDQTIHLGTYTAGEGELQRLEGGGVTVELVD